jgi:hypothetical protein
MSLDDMMLSSDKSNFEIFGKVWEIKFHFLKQEQNLLRQSAASTQLPLE